MTAVFVKLGSDLNAVYKGDQSIPVQLLQMGVGAGQFKKPGVAVRCLLCGTEGVQLLKRRFQPGGLFFQITLHLSCVFYSLTISQNPLASFQCHTPYFLPQPINHKLFYDRSCLEETGYTVMKEMPCSGFTLISK